MTVAKIIAEHPNPAKVHLIAESVSATEIDRLHTRGDCFLSLTRSEGWGLGSFDAALFGNPVIITGWGGQLDYLGRDYPYLIDYDMQPTMVSPPDGCFLRVKEAVWAHADQTHARFQMRKIFEDQKDAKSVAQELQSVLQQKYAPKIVCSRLARLMGFSVNTSQPTFESH